MVDNIANINNTNHSSDKPQTAVVDNIANINNTNHSSDKHQTAMVDNIANNEEWFVLLLLAILSTIAV
jgi:hypothetical protein